MTGSHTRRLAIAALAAALSLGFAPAARAAVTNVHTAPATPGAVRFTVTVPSPQLDRLDRSNGLTRLGLDGFTLEGPSRRPGLPVRVVNVAVPPLGSVQITAAASGMVSYDGVLLEPRPGPHGEQVPGDPAAYGAAGSPAPPAARLLGVTWLRNQRIARVAIEPAAYEPSARRLTLAQRVDVELRVQPMDALGPPMEADDPFEPVYRLTLVNYEQGVAWRRPQAAALASVAKRMGVRPDAALSAKVLSTTVYAGHEWVKIAVPGPGMYAVDFGTLRTLQIFNNKGVRFDSLRVFTLPGYPLLPEQTFCDSCDMQEVAIGTFDVSDGSTSPDSMFASAGDYFYFFAQGSSGWASDFDPSLPDTSYLNNPYDANNYYYLTVATDPSDQGGPIGGVPARLPFANKTPLSGSGATVLTTFDERTHFEQDNPGEYWPDATSLIGTNVSSTLAWEKWFWTSMKPGDTFTYPFDLPGVDGSQPARFRLRDWGLTDAGCYGGDFDHLLDVSLNTLVIPRKGWKGQSADNGGQVTIDTTATFLHPVGNTLQVTSPAGVREITCPNRNDISGLAWFDLFYKRHFIPVANQLTFHSPQAPGVYHYDVGPFVFSGKQAGDVPGLVRLFDITDPLHPIEIMVKSAMVTAVAGGFEVSFEDTQTVQRRYTMLPDSLISIAHVTSTSLANAPTTSLNNLRAQQGADYVVIYYDGFQDAANALATARQSRLPLPARTGGYSTLAVPISAIYDQFSGGRTDPTAIRNFLRAAFYNWTLRPRFVTFLGDASYDFKNLKGRAPAGQPGCLLPSYENMFDFSIEVRQQFATDDWLLDVVDPSSLLPDFYSGRIPADDAATALSVVNQKILGYETAAPLGEYRNRIMFIADDDHQGTACDDLGWGHVAQTYLLDSLDTPAHFDRDYVFLNMYATGPGSTKPGARTDILKNIDNGVAIFNFVGHGSPFKLSDESVLIDSDAGTLTNGLQMPLFCAASCDVGRFDDPTLQSLGERLEMSATNGTVGVLSATGEAFSDQNSALNQFLYQRFFDRGTVHTGADSLVGTGQYHVPVAGALLAAKLGAGGTSTTNNSKYQLMGDSGLLLNLPHDWVNLTLTDATGAPVTQLARGQTIRFTGAVVDQPGGSPVALSNGTASIFIEDSAPTLNTGLSPDCVDFETATNYRYTAGPIYHGDVSLASGTFQGRFVVPMDAAIGPHARMRAYVQGRAPADASETDGVGAVVVPVVTGTPDPTDVTGPRITLEFVGGALSVRPDATLRIDLFDQNGIMTTGHSPQNSIIVTLDDNTTSRVDVTSTFRYAADSYQSGSATFQLPNLSAGHHKVQVGAADNLATGLTSSDHRSSASLEFDVVTRPALHITQSYLFPNPTRSKGPGSGGTFVVDAPGDSVNTLLRVYTVSGKMVRTLRSLGALGQVQIPWDGRDDEGDPLANGTYLYRVFTYTRESGGTSSASEKADAAGRFVIINR